LALNYQLKNYDKAIDYGQRASAGGLPRKKTRTSCAGLLPEGRLEES
jgi:hypothetical protein